jgi:osmotically-inducible protein OsmY
MGLSPAALPAAEPSAGSPKSSRESELRDDHLTLLARQVLDADTQLSRFNLGVRMRDGVATVFGAVDAAETAQRALLKVRQVPGVTAVYNLLSINPASQPPLPKDKPPPPDPDRTRPPGALTHMSDKPAVGQPFSTTNDSKRPLREAVTLGPPVRSGQPAGGILAPQAGLLAPKPVSEADHLLLEIKRLVDAEARFRRVQVEVNGRAVILSGGVARAADIQQLAQAVARLPGVEQVSLGPVQLSPDPAANDRPRSGLRIAD